MFMVPPIDAAYPRSADIRMMRSHNAAVVLNLVWENVDGISRADIARASGMSPSTVSGIVSDLPAQNLLQGSHLAPSKGGRPAHVLRFNTRRNHIVGLELGAAHVTVALCDLRGAVHWHRTVDTDVAGDPKGTVTEIERL